MRGSRGWSRGQPRGRVVRAGTQPGSSPTLCTTVTIVNNSDEPAAFHGALDWDLQDPAGASRGSTFIGSTTLLNSGELVPGGTATGDVCFDNPTGAAGQYAVSYAPAFSSDDRAVWVNNR